MKSKIFELPKQFATKWVGALRGGEYQQIQNQYTTGDGCFCVLGLGHHIDGCKVDGKGSDAFLDSFSNKLPCSNLGHNGGLYSELTKMNDEGITFPVMADWIEANVNFI